MGDVKYCEQCGKEIGRECAESEPPSDKCFKCASALPVFKRKCDEELTKAQARIAELEEGLAEQKKRLANYYKYSEVTVAVKDKALDEKRALRTAIKEYVEACDAVEDGESVTEAESKRILAGFSGLRALLEKSK